MKIRSLLLALPLLLAAAGHLSAQIPDDEGVKIEVGGRLHTQFNTTSIDDVPPSQLFIRRARLEIDVRINDRVTGAIAPDFAGDEVTMKDAFIDVAFAPETRLRVGKMYRPFGLLEQTSSKRILMVERGLRIRGLDAADEYAILNDLEYSDRDIGVQVLGEGFLPGISYAAGVFRGPLHGQVGDSDSYQYVAEAKFRLAPALRLGAAWSNRQFVDSIAGVQELDRGNAFEVDLEYGAFAPGPHLLAEISTGDLDPFGDTRFRAAQVWLAYRTHPLTTLIQAVEPVLRVSHADTDVTGLDELRGGTLITPGINIHVGPLDRIMLNYDIWQGADGAPDARSFKAMFSLGF